jgi:hypothetical protein
LLQQQAKRDKVNAIQDQLSGDTRDLLIRFGRQKALAGGGLGGGSTAGSLGLFGMGL